MTVPVRAVHTACTVPGHEAPYDTAHLKVFYPAAPTGDMAERMTGVIPADASGAPYPVVVLFNGINVTADSYRWLAVALAERGYVAVTFTFVEEVFGTGVAVSPGIDVGVLRPETFGSGPCGTALQPVLDALAKLGGPLEGLLDLDRVAIGGHSGGGTVVLQSANPAWFPQVRAVFTYGAHAMASTVLGWPTGHVLDLSDDVAVLLMTGEHDGVMAASAVRYGEEADADRVDPVARTFDQSFAGGRGDVHHVVLRGANHFTVAHPLDLTSARAFLDEPATGDEDAAREAIADTLGLFLDGQLRGSADAREQLAGWTTAPPPAVLSARSK
jgi:dienelactone hydrolase